jgi:acylpyruvate hydrolase
MKIIAIGRNYVEHIYELQNTIPDEPVIFLMPETSLLQRNQPFFYPSFTKNLHYEVELVVKINRLGKNIAAKFAHRYYSEITVGIDFTARDLQDTLKAKGLPWEKAKAFDHSAPIGQFMQVSELTNAQNIVFTLEKNGIVVQQGESAKMIHNIDAIIAHVSQYFTLKIGDLIFTGTPAGVGPVSIGDELRACIEGRELLKTNIR